MNPRALAAQADAARSAGSSGSGRSHKRADAKEKDWKREQGRLMKEKVR